MSECTHNCSTCGESCGERTSPQSFLKKPHADAHIGKVFGVVSGKGGVGKSMVTSQLAVSLRRKGYRVGILDADITGPSIPKAFGMHEKAVGTENALLPCVSSTGIEVMSINLLLDDETDPVIWRGPVIGGVVTQFWTDVLWDVDYLLVDMPPGTGDVTLSVFQSIPLSGIVVVASPQELVGMVVEKAVKMAEKMAVPRLSRLRQKNLPLRRGQERRGREKARSPAARPNAHRPAARRPHRRGPHRGIQGRLARRRRHRARGPLTAPAKKRKGCFPGNILSVFSFISPRAASRGSARSPRPRGPVCSAAWSEWRTRAQRPPRAAPPRAAFCP